MSARKKMRQKRNAGRSKRLLPPKRQSHHQNRPNVNYLEEVLCSTSAVLTALHCFNSKLSHKSRTNTTSEKPSGCKRCTQTTCLILLCALVKICTVSVRGQSSQVEPTRYCMNDWKLQLTPVIGLSFHLQGQVGRSPSSSQPPTVRSPGQGLRLGLSRLVRVKPLHPSVASHW